MKIPSQNLTLKVSNREFLTHAFGHCKSDEWPWVTGFAGDPNSVAHGVWFGRPALPLPMTIREVHNNYVVVSTFKRGEDGILRRAKKHFSGMFVVMIDDVGTKVSFDRLHLKPTCLVETSPGNYQAWYFLTEPERDQSRAERLIKGLIASGLTEDGSDPGMNGVTRYGRLPVGINGKAKYADGAGNPFVQRVACWGPEARYPLSDLAKAYAIDLDKAPMPKQRAVRQAIKRTGDHDNLLKVIDAMGLYLEPIGSFDGGHHILCPWLYQHTDEDSSGTAYFEPSDENAWAGGFKCHHGHCQHRTIADLTHFVSRALKKNMESA